MIRLHICVVVFFIVSAITEVLTRKIVVHVSCEWETSLRAAANNIHCLSRATSAACTKYLDFLPRNISTTCPEISRLLAPKYLDYLPRNISTTCPKYLDYLPRNISTTCPEISRLLAPKYPDYPVSYTPLRPHETSLHIVCRLLLENKKK